MLAGGISMYRIALPIFIMGFILNIALASVQEFVLPPLAKNLARTPPDLKYQGQAKQTALRFVPDTEGRLFSASAYDLVNEKMSIVTVLLRDKVVGEDGSVEWGRAYGRITADEAEWNAEDHRWDVESGFAAQEAWDPVGRRPCYPC